MFVVYWKASKFLNGGSGDWGAEDVPLLDTVEQQGQPVKEDTKTFRSMSSSKLAFTPEEEIITNTTIDLSFKYVEKNSYLSGLIENIQGLNIISNHKLNFVRFHATLLPLKQDKFKTKYRSIAELNVNTAFGLNGLSRDDLRSSKVRIRMCGRLIKRGVPLGREKCLGEIYVDLAKYRGILEVGKEVRTKYAVLPKGNAFPKPKT